MQRSRSAIKSYRVFGDVSSELRCIVSEAVVCQFRLVVVVLPLKEEWYSDTIAVGDIPVVHLLEYPTIHIQPATPNLLSLDVVRLSRRTRLVGYDAVRLAIEQECHRHKALLLKDPRPQVKLVVLPAVVLPRLPRVPLVQWHIAIPYPVSVLAGELADASP